MRTRATLTVHGPRQLLRAFRKRVVETFGEEAAEVALREDHGEDALSFELDAPAGIPFPPLVAISAQYPDCVATVLWSQDDAQGETTVQNGQVKEASRGAGAADKRLRELRLAADGGLELAIALDPGADGIIGFCATADAETYFKLRGDAARSELFTISGADLAWDECWRGDDVAALAPPVPLAAGEQRALDHLAATLRSEWLWYDHAPEEETAVERQRYAEAGRPVRAINVKSHKLAVHPQTPPPSLAADQAWIAALLARTWVRGVLPK